MSHTPVLRTVASHPRLIAALFTVTLLLVQVGAVLADGGACPSCGGP